LAQRKRRSGVVSGGLHIVRWISQQSRETPCRPSPQGHSLSSTIGGVSRSMTSTEGWQSTLFHGEYIGSENLHRQVIQHCPAILAANEAYSPYSTIHLCYCRSGGASVQTRGFLGLCSQSFSLYSMEASTVIVGWWVDTICIVLSPCIAKSESWSTRQKLKQDR
jgi:hypothetical protein